MPGVMLLPTLLSEISSHDLELAETLIGVLRFMLIFVAARTLAEVLVRFELPTILGELLAGVLIGASGLHLLVPPETQVQLSGAFSEVVSGLSHVPVEEIPIKSGNSRPSLVESSRYALITMVCLALPVAVLMARGR